MSVPFGRAALPAAALVNQPHEFPSKRSGSACYFAARPALLEFLYRTRSRVFTLSPEGESLLFEYKAATDGLYCQERRVGRVHRGDDGRRCHVEVWWTGWHSKC